MKREKIERKIAIRKEIERIDRILIWLPAIRSIIRAGGTWEQLKATCEPLGLDDTAFRDEPTIKDYLVDYKYWRKRLKELAINTYK